MKSHSIGPGVGVVKRTVSTTAPWALGKTRLIARTEVWMVKRPSGCLLNVHTKAEAVGSVTTVVPITGVPGARRNELVAAFLMVYPPLPAEDTIHFCEAAVEEAMLTNGTADPALQRQLSQNVLLAGFEMRYVPGMMGPTSSKFQAWVSPVTAVVVRRETPVTDVSWNVTARPMLIKMRQALPSGRMNQFEVWLCEPTIVVPMTGKPGANIASPVPTFLRVKFPAPRPGTAVNVQSWFVPLLIGATMGGWFLLVGAVSALPGAVAAVMRYVPGTSC